MPNTASSFGEGFTTSLTNALTQNRDRKRADEDRKQSHALQAFNMMWNSGQVESIDDALPILSVAMPDIFGEAATKGKKKEGAFDGQAIVKNILGQALAKRNAGPAMPGPAATPAAPDAITQASSQLPMTSASGDPMPTPLESRPVTVPDQTAPPEGRSLLGVPLMSPEQVHAKKIAQDAADQETALKTKLTLATRMFPLLKAVDPTQTFDDALSFVGVKPFQAHQFTPQAIGKPVTADDVPVNALGQNGAAIDKTKAKFWQPVRGTTGEIFWEPGAEPIVPAKAAVKLTGKAGEAVEEALMAQGLDPRVIEADSPEYHAAVGKASKMLAADRALTNESRSTMIALRNWTLGLGATAGGGGGTAAAGGTGTPGAPGAPGAAGGPAPSKAVLNSLSADEKAEAWRIANYTQALTARGMGTPRMDKIMRAAQEINPSFDQTQYQTRQRARIGFTTGKQGDNVRSLNTALGHLGTMADKALALDNSDVQLWNRISNAGISQTGDKRVEGFLTVAEALSSELVNLFRGGVGAEDDVKAWRARLNTARSPQQLAEVLQAGAQLVQSRQSALEQQWKTAMGDTPFEFLSAEAKKGIAKLDTQTRRLQGGGQSAPAAAGGAAKEGDTKPIPGHPGTEQTFKGGKWVRTK